MSMLEVAKTDRSCFREAGSSSLNIQVRNYTKHVQEHNCECANEEPAETLKIGIVSIGSGWTKAQK